MKLGDEWLSVVANPTTVDEAAVPPAYATTFVARDATDVLTKRDVPLDHLNTFRRGAGFVRRRSADDDGGLAWCEDLLSHYENGLVLGPKRAWYGPGLDMLAPAAPAHGTPIIDSRHYNGYRWCITAGLPGRVIAFNEDNPALPPLFSPALGFRGDPGGSLDPGYACQGIEVFVDANGAPALYVTAYNSSTGQTRIYQCLGTVWSTTPPFPGAGTPFTKRLGLLTTVWWEGPDGVATQRLIAADQATIWQCPDGANPLLEASWVGQIKVGNRATPITKLLAFPEFALAVKPDGIHTVNGVRAMNLTPYWNVGGSYTDGRVAALYQNGVVAARGYGLDYYDARQMFRRQDSAVEVGPMFAMQDGTPIRGHITAMVPYEGAMLMALYNHSNRTSYVGRAYPRELIGVQVPNPWVHYWAEHVLPPGIGPGQQITHLVVSSPTVAPSTVIRERLINLWMFVADEPMAGAQDNYTLHYCAMARGSGPISLQVSGGQFAYTSRGRGYFTSQTWDDPLATKYVRRIEVAGTQMGPNQPVALHTRTDGNPTTITDHDPDTTTWALAGTIGTQADDTPTGGSIYPTDPVAGRDVGLMVEMTTNNPNVSPTVSAISPRAKVARETFPVLVLWAILERDHELATGTRDIRDPDTVLAAITRLQDLGPVDYVTEYGGPPVKVYVEQGIEVSRQYVGDYQWRSLAKLELTRVSPATVP